MTTDTDTNLEICTAALRKIGVVGMGVTASADEIETARVALGRMLKSWQSRGYNLWAVTSMSVTATTSASYSLTPARPLALQSVRFKSGSETPMLELSREEYDNLPLKSAAGRPTCFYYDRQKEAGTLYVWPVLSSVTTETLEITYIRELIAARVNVNLTAQFIPDARKRSRAHRGVKEPKAGNVAAHQRYISPTK